jgi:ABC-type branched-subunit amino acid transport system substrate-binding protein
MKHAGERSGARSRRRTRATLILLTATLVGGATAARGETTVAIGVISPESGRSGPVGLAHRKSIEWGLQNVGYSIVAGGRHITLRAIFEDDHGDPAESVNVAQKLASEDHVVAILGPANSACASAVLDALDGPEGHVPVISSLSSAPSLSNPRNPYFFRATIDDRERMHRLVHFLQVKHQLADSVVLLYEDDAYGQGLAASLVDAVGGTNVKSMPWSDAQRDPAATVAALPSGRISLFVLGTETIALDIADKLDDQLMDVRAEGEVQFFFVGTGERLQQEAPDDSITIGEPIPDIDVAPLLDAPDMVDPFVGRDRQFLLTAYETARFILPKALQYALAGGTDPNDVATVRERLKDALDSKIFDSLSPTRKIRFAGGNLVDPPRTPIYKVDRTLSILDKPAKEGWLTVNVPERARFLEEPVQIVLERHGRASRDSIKLEVLDENDGIVESTSIDLGDVGKASYTFHPRRPGHFRVWASGFMVPNDPSVEIEYPLDYGIAIAGALLGAAIALRSFSIPFARALQGIGVGIVFFGLSSYGRSVPGLASLPLPSLSASRPVNAFFIGMLGGVGGLETLLFLLRQLPGWPAMKGPEQPEAPSAPAPAPLHPQ